MSNTGASSEVVKLQVFNGMTEKVIACKLFLRMRMREDVVEKQIQ